MIIGLLATAGDTTRVVFTYHADQGLSSVSVAGTFNNWTNGANKLTMQPDGRTWSTAFNVAYGRVSYKFILNGNQWIVDPVAKNEGDGNGNINSIRLVLPPDYAKPASPRDGILAESAILHSQAAPYLNYDRGKLTLRLRIRPDDAESISLQLAGKALPMQIDGGNELYETYSIQLPWNRKADLSYGFKLQDGRKTFWYGSTGISNEPVPFELKKSFKPFEVPSWVEKSIIYQIFPDRFANGDKSNDPKDVMPWDGKPTFSNRFGGDVAGVRQHLGYLKDLGVSTLYFNPVFRAPSNHRYDASDFKQVDPEFGTNAEFGELTKEAKADGMGTVMDFAFNHSAVDFAPFMDIRKNGPASSFKDWYFIKSYPVEVKENPPYVGWFNSPYMPKLNVMNPDTHRYLIGLADFWKKTAPGLEGMRLDAANEVDDQFWKDLRPTAKSVDPNMWILGEVWGDGSHWLGGNMWDSVMNYPFRNACIGFFAEGKTKPSEFTRSLLANYNSYAPQVSRNMMNLLSSHDTERFYTLCHGDGSLAKLAATVQFTWAGAPSIYYGEEIGMDGGRDPDNRRGMVWAKATSDNDMLSYYRKLTSARNASSALQSGDPVVLKTNDDNGTLAYARTLQGDSAVVAINRSAESHSVSFSLSDSILVSAAKKNGFIDIISGRRYPSNRSLSVPLEPHQAAILLPATGRFVKLANARVTTNAKARSSVSNVSLLFRRNS